MTAPMPEREFFKLVSEHGCTVEKSRKEWKILNGIEPIMSFAVAHKKRGKREVKPFYVRCFRRLIEELNL